MWINFVECPVACEACSQEDFELNLLRYLRANPALTGLLAYMPPLTLLRVHLEDCALCLTAMTAPPDAILFQIGALLSMDLGNGRTERQGMRENYTYRRQPSLRALAFFATEVARSPFAARFTTEMHLLDYVRLFDLTRTAEFTLNARFELTRDEFSELCDRHETSFR